MNILNQNKRGMVQKAFSIILISVVIFLAAIFLIQAENSTFQNQTNDTGNFILNVSENTSLLNNTINYSNDVRIVNNSNITEDNHTNINDSINENITDNTSSIQTSLNETPKVSQGNLDQASPSSQGDALDTGSVVCKNFTEQVLWSSNYTKNPGGSTNYQTWYPKNNCSSINAQNCFIGYMELKTRFLYFEDNNKNGQGYIQISNSGEQVCNNPESGVYERYLAYESIKGNSQGINKQIGNYCGNNKNSDSKCGIQPENTSSFQNCYGIKSYADSYLIVDAFEIKYDLCYNE